MNHKWLEPMTESMFYVLMALWNGDKFAPEIVEWVKNRSEGRVSVGAGTLYSILAQFSKHKIITETITEEKKRRFKLTQIGRNQYEGECKRLRLCIEDAEKGAH